MASRAAAIVGLVTPLLCSSLLIACQAQSEPAAQVSAAALGGDSELTLGPEVRLPGRDVVTAGQHDPALSWDGSRYLMAWRDGLGDIIGVWVEPDGTQGEGFLIGRSSPHVTGPVISRDAVHGEQVVFWIQPHADDALGDIAAWTVPASESGSDAGAADDAGQVGGEEIVLLSASVPAVPLAAASDGSGHFVIWRDDQPAAILGHGFAAGTWSGGIEVSALGAEGSQFSPYPPPDLASDGVRYLLFWTDGDQREVRTLLNGTLGAPRELPIGHWTDVTWNGANGYFLADTRKYLQLDPSGTPTAGPPMGDWPLDNDHPVASVQVTAVGTDTVAAFTLINDWDGSVTKRVDRISALGALTTLEAGVGAVHGQVWDGQRPVLAMEHDHNYDFYAPATVALKPVGSSEVDVASLAADSDAIDLALNGDHYLVTWGGGIGSASVHGLLARVEDSSVVRDDIRFASVPPPGAFIQRSIGPRAASNGDGYMVAWREALGDPDIAFGSAAVGALLDASGELHPGAGEPGDPTFRLSEAGQKNWQRTTTVTAVASDGTDYLVAFEDGYGALVARLQSADGTELGPPIALGQINRTVEAAWDGETYVVVWEAPGDVDVDIKVARVTRDGELLDPDGIWIADGVGDQRRPKIAVGEGVSLIVWNEVRDAVRANVQGALFTPQSVVHPAVQLAPSAIAQFAPAAAWDGRQFVVAWTAGSDPMHWDVVARGVPPVPGSLLGDPFVIAETDEREYAPTLASVEGKGALIAYHRAQARGREIGVRRLLRDPLSAPEDAGDAQDATTPRSDAGGADGGADAAAADALYDDDGACLCSAPGGATSSAAPWLAPLGLLAMLVRRQRRRRD
jgi:hypothetical protein